MILGINCLPLHLEKAFFSIMQNNTDKGTLLVSKSLPVANSNSVNRLFSARNNTACLPRCKVSSFCMPSVEFFSLYST